jgi:hypothetical protein
VIVGELSQRQVEVEQVIVRRSELVGSVHGTGMKETLTTSMTTAASWRTVRAEVRAGHHRDACGLLLNRASNSSTGPW